MPERDPADISGGFALGFAALTANLPRHFVVVLGFAALTANLRGALWIRGVRWCELA